jgi:hypothetical protein
VRATISRLARRVSILAIGLAGAAFLASSCSLDAAVLTDRSGRVIGVSSLRIQSTVQNVGLAMLVGCRQLVLELRWRPGLPASHAL